MIMSVLTFVAKRWCYFPLLLTLHTNTLIAPGKPTALKLHLTTPTSITLSWTAPSSVVDTYEVKWERNTTRKCSDVDEGSAIITDYSTNYTITRLQEDSAYTITMTMFNAFGNTVTSAVSRLPEAGEEL